MMRPLAILAIVVAFTVQAAAQEKLKELYARL